MVDILFLADRATRAAYADLLPAALAGLGIDARIMARTDAPRQVDYIIYAPGDDTPDDFTPFTSCKAVLGLWAGVEQIVGNPTLTMPLCRMVDAGLTEGMVEWVTGHVLRHHLGLDLHIHGQDGVWRQDVAPPLARDRHVTILGLGALGAACGAMLAHLGFPLTGWSRSQKALPNMTCLAGADGLIEALRGADILVLLLPLTPRTRHVIDAGALAELPKGAVILNPGRGALIEDAALLTALDRGHIGHATLDTFATEPLPAAHPFWAHPGVTVTPHIASTTRPDTAARAIARNIAGHESGAPLENLVNRDRGY